MFNRSGPAPSVRSRRQIAAAVSAVALATTMAACSSSSSGSTTSTTATANTRAVYVNKSGLGNGSISTVTLPKNWTLTWKFVCDQTGGAKPFVLSVTAQGGTRTVVTNQTGLGGGGHKPYTSSGDYSFQVQTPCTWNVTVKPTPATVLPNAKTTAPSTTATTKAP